MQTFSTLSLPRALTLKPVKPVQPAAPRSPAAPYTQEQVNASLAANPRAGLQNLSPDVFAPLNGVNPPSQSTTPPGDTKPPASQTSLYDLSTDPVVQRIRALNTSDYSGAIGKADEARKQLLISAGLPDVARAAQFGSLEQPSTGDQATALAAEQNPFSLARALTQTHMGNEQTIDRTRSRQNLGYSSTRANDLAQESRNYLGQQASLQDQVRAQLAAIIDQLTSARASELQREADALATARQNAITNALASGLVLVGFDQNGNPIFRNLGDLNAGGGGTTADYYARNPMPAGTTTAQALAALAQQPAATYNFQPAAGTIPEILSPDAISRAMQQRVNRIGI